MQGGYFVPDTRGDFVFASSKGSSTGSAMVIRAIDSVVSVDSSDRSRSNALCESATPNSSYLPVPGGWTDETIPPTGACLLQDEFRREDPISSDWAFQRWAVQLPAEHWQKSAAPSTCEMSRSNQSGLFISSTSLDRPGTVGCGLQTTDPIVNFLAEPQRISLSSVRVANGYLRVALRSYPVKQSFEAGLYVSVNGTHAVVFSKGSQAGLVPGGCARPGDGGSRSIHTGSSEAPSLNLTLDLSPAWANLTMQCSDGSRPVTVSHEHGIQIWGLGHGATGAMTLGIGAALGGPGLPPASPRDPPANITVAGIAAVSTGAWFESPAVLQPIQGRARFTPAFFGNDTQARAYDWGVIDPTQQPFNADPSGAADSTHALRFALDFARRSGLAVRLPVGNYSVSDTLSLY